MFRRNCDVGSTPPVDSVFEYLARHRSATLAHLAAALGMPEEQLDSTLETMGRQGWLNRGWARLAANPDVEVTIFTLTHEGKLEIDRRGLPEDAPEPIVVTKDELIAELSRRGFDPAPFETSVNLLHAGRFRFWPSMPAYSAIGED